MHILSKKYNENRLSVPAKTQENVLPELRGVDTLCGCSAAFVSSPRRLSFLLGIAVYFCLKYP